MIFFMCFKNIFIEIRIQTTSIVLAFDILIVDVTCFNTNFQLFTMDPMFLFLSANFLFKVLPTFFTSVLKFTNVCVIEFVKFA